MILGFRTTHKGRPTGFVEKINSGQKIHTFREDKNRRWKAGRHIEFATGVRTKQYEQFKNGTCRSVQGIQIKYWDDGLLRGLYVFVDGRLLSVDQTEELIRNDGFDSSLGFYEWFKEDFEGYIIHWTDKRY